MTLVAAAAMPLPAPGQVLTDVQQAPTLTIERYPEDWSNLAVKANRTGRWTEPFKYIPWATDGSTYLTTGAELRIRYEGYKNANWGAAPDDHYTWYRFLPYADLHVGSARVFVQPIVSAIRGTGRARTPVDTTATDILQAFAEVEFEVAGGATARVSVGRKLVSLGAGRFIDTRYGPNIPQAFDGTDVTLADDGGQLRAFYLRPVDTRGGAFDDTTSHQRSVWGIYGTRWVGRERNTGLDVFFLGFRDTHALFDQGAGRELAHTVGARLFGDTGTQYWNLEGVLQRGSFAGKRVAAGGIGGELGHRFMQARLQPIVALTADYISGDADPGDKRLGTFNPMFPRGKYFAAQSPVGPRNLIHAQPSITVHPAEAVAVSMTGVAYWRASTRDGLYNIPGALVRSGQASDARFIGTQLELAVAWQATAELNLSTSMSAFFPGRFIRETGPSRTMRVAAAMANFRF
ncbi:hypothetical protein VI08_06795 [Luteibacter yeojuensis]|uniref:Alginate export domain-containing protein n=2 Tax=Luteibacter yeojuensis TaxID=345309 RepID=A0A0F3KX47_9GAMM|nr:hypothetical protein VI08_06795 [Luteibacter yeojuensis]